MKKILGTMIIPTTDEETKKWLLAAHDAGYDWVDTAYVYGGEGKNEQILGRVLSDLAKEGITFKYQTKIWTTFFKETRAMALKQLELARREKFDALLLHRPSLNFYEAIDAWKELIKLQKEGIVDEIGVSNFDKDMIEILFEQTGVWPQINQVEHSVSYVRMDRIVFAKEHSIELQSWSPMGKDVKANLNHPVVLAIAKNHHINPAQVLISYSTSLGLMPVIGTNNANHLKENLEWINLSSDELKALSVLNTFSNKFEETYPH